MLNNKTNLLMERTSKLGMSTPLTIEEIQSVEHELDIILPYDFKELCLYCSYEFFSYFDTYNFCSDNKHGVIAQTEAWRNSIKLPENYLVLSDDGTSAILMKIDKSESTVIWCSLEDVLNLCENKDMQYNPTIFPSFVDFYEFLLDEEEKIQAEDQLLDN